MAAVQPGALAPGPGVTNKLLLTNIMNLGSSIVCVETQTKEMLLVKIRIKSSVGLDNVAWLTPGIKMSCINKRKLFLIQRNSNDPKLTTYYKTYCRIVTSVIRLAKERYCNSIITCSNNETKTTFNIIKNTLNMKLNTHNITSINVNGNLVTVYWLDSLAIEC
jgi:hypothetical protein